MLLFFICIKFYYISFTFLVAIRDTAAQAIKDKIIVASSWHDIKFSFNYAIILLKLTVLIV